MILGHGCKIDCLVAEEHLVPAEVTAAVDVVAIHGICWRLLQWCDYGCSVRAGYARGPSVLTFTQPIRKRQRRFCILPCLGVVKGAGGCRGGAWEGVVVVAHADDRRVITHTVSVCGVTAMRCAQRFESGRVAGSFGGVLVTNTKQLQMII